MSDEPAELQALRGRTEAEDAAYAVVAENDDPYAKAIQTLVEHSRELEQTIATLKERLVRLERIEAVVRAAWPEEIAPGDLSRPALWREVRKARVALFALLDLEEFQAAEGGLSG